MADDSKTFLIKIISDKASASRVKQDVDGVKRELLSLEETASKVGDKLGSLQRVAKLDSVGAQFGSMAVKINDVDEAARRLSVTLKAMNADANETARATTAFFNAQQAAQDAVATGGRSVGGVSKLTAFGSKLRALPSLQIPGTNTGTDSIANVIRLLGSLPTAALPVVAALGAVAAAFVIMDKSLEEARTALKNALEASNAYYKAVQELSTQQARDRVAELEKTNAALKAANEEQSKAAVAGINSTKDSFSGVLSVLGAVNPALEKGALALILQKDGTLAVTDSINANTTEITKNQAEIDRLTGGLSANAFAANDAAEAEKKLAAVRDQLAEDTIARAKRDSGLKRNGSEEQVQGLIDDLQAEQGAINQVFKDVANGARKLSDDELEKLHTQFEKNAVDIADLTNNMLAFGKANDLRKQQEKDALAAARDLAKVGDDIAKADEKRLSDLQAIADRTAESYRKLKENFDQADAEAVIKANQELAKSTRTRADEDIKNNLDLQYKLSKIGDDTKDAAIKAAIDRNEAVTRIDRDYARSAQEAIANRDAVALAKAQQKKSDDLADTQKAYEKDKKQAEDNAEKKRKELLADFAQQRRIEALQRAAQDRERDIAYDNDKAARRRKYLYDQDQLQAAQRADTLARNSAYIKTILDLQKFLTEYKAAHVGIGGDVLAYYIKLRNDITKILGGSGGSSSPSGTLPPSHYVPGGVNGFGVGFGAGAFASQSAFAASPKAGSPITFAPVLNGNSRAQLKQEFDKHMDSFLDEAGY